MQWYYNQSWQKTHNIISLGNWTSKKTFASVIVITDLLILESSNHILNSPVNFSLNLRTTHWPQPVRTVVLYTPGDTMSTYFYAKCVKESICFKISNK